jgi:hypothetical protein
VVAEAKMGFVWMLLCALGCNLASLTPSQTLQPDAITAPTTEQVAAWDSLLREIRDAGEVGRCHELFDSEQLIARALQGLTLRADLVVGVRVGFTQNLPQICTNLSRAGDLQFLRTDVIDGESWVRYRYLFEEGGFEHMLFLMTSDGVDARVVDVWALSGGDTTGEQLRRRIIAVSPDGRTLDKREAATNDVVNEMVAHNNQAEWQHALDVWEKLDADQRKLPQSQLQRLVAATGLGGDVYLAALEDFVASNPDLPAARFHAIDLAYMKGDLPAAAKASEDLYLLLQDPYALILAASIHLQIGDRSNTRQLLQRARLEEPDFDELRNAWLDLMVAEGNHVETIATIEDIEAKDDLIFYAANMEATPVFEAFLESDEYKAWKPSRPDFAVPDAAPVIAPREGVAAPGQR